MSSFIAFGVGTSVSLDEMLAPVNKGAFVVGDGPGDSPEEVVLLNNHIFIGATGEATGVLSFATLLDSMVTSGNVTQHEADLTILESQITDGSLLARVGSVETITAAWSFDLLVTALEYATTNNGVVIQENGANTQLRSAAGNVNLVNMFGTVAFNGSNGLFQIPVALTINETSVGPDLGAANGGFWVKDDVPATPQFTDDTSVDHPLAMLDVAQTWTAAQTMGDLKLTGNLVVDGATVTVTSEQVNVSDNHLYLNQGYTPAVAQTGGLVVNYLPTATTDTVAAPGFVAGVPATSNPTCETVGAATFAAGEFVQYSGANEDSNDGLYEVLSHAANVLTIRGVGITGRVEDFTQNDFTADTTATGTITKVTVAVLRAGTDGLWEQAEGSTTPLTFSNLLVSSDIGSSVQADLDVVSQGDAEAGTATDERIWTAERVAQAIAALAGGAIDNNFIFSHDTTTQAMSVASTFQGLNFSANEGSFDGWTHVAGTSIFGCNQTGSYDVKLVTKWRKSTGGIASYGVRALFDGTEVVGSMDGDEITANNQTIGLTTFFSVDAVDGQDLDIEAVGSTTNLSVVPAPNPGSATTAISAKITITRRS